VHELVQASCFFDQMFTRFQVQVVGVGENDLGAGIVNLRRSHCLEGTMSPHRHENRCLYRAVLCCDATPAGTGLLVSGEQFKLQHNGVSFNCRRRCRYGVYLLLMMRTLSELIADYNNQK